MSMREYPSSGYTVPLKNIRNILVPHMQEAFDALLEEVEDGDKDTEDLGEFLTAALCGERNAHAFPPFSIYRPADEDTPDDDNMETGEYYAVFDEADLYVKQETPEHAAMKKLGVAPKFSRWSVWG